MGYTVLYLVFVCTSVSFNVEGKTSFIKDLKTNIPFPPENTQHTVAGIPEGHLRPLGWQKKPDGKVREEKEAVSPPIFHQRYVKPGKPAVLRATIKNSPALLRFEEDAYLKEKYGKTNVTITVKKELHDHSQRTPRRMLFRKFLLDYMYENWYLASTIHQDMLEEFPLPAMLSCGTYKDRLVRAEFWMSSGGTASLLHSHGDHNLHCIVDGRKDFIVIEPKHKNVFDYHENYPNSGSGHSPLDVDMINVFKYPKIAKTPWTYSTLWPGDCIYIPAGHLHQVRSYGRGISFTLTFAPSLDYESTDCKEDESKNKQRRKKKKEEEAEKKEETEETTLADVNLVWSYSNGVTHLSDTTLTPDSLRRILHILLRDGDSIHINQFQHFYQEALNEDPERPPADEIFHIMTPNDTRDTLTRDEILALAPSRLQHVCDVFNKMHRHLHDEL